jgi:tRNA wybutosine-synthesizing protein 1
MTGYADLVKIGNPDFIEIKGVTYCGTTSKGANLTMDNVPWHTEVLSFASQLAGLLESNYSIATEHEHSCCVLLANNKFRVDNVWHTWIDYDKFHQLIKRYYSSGGVEVFSSSDYMCPTPDWAVFGAEKRGFDPNETRFRRNKIAVANDKTIA